MTTSTNPSAFPAPPITTPFVDDFGRITQVWYRWLLTIFLRTGGSGGMSPDSLAAFALAAGTEEEGVTPLAPLWTHTPQDVPQQFILPLTTDELGVTPPAPLWIATDELGVTPPAPLWIATPQDTSEDALTAALVASTEVEPTTPAAPIAVTLGASPATYTAPVNGTLFLAAGTVSSIQISRDGGSTYYDTGVIVGPIPASQSDIVQVTYTVAPTTQVFFPR